MGLLLMCIFGVFIGFMSTMCGVGWFDGDITKAILFNAAPIFLLALTLNSVGLL